MRPSVVRSASAQFRIVVLGGGTGGCSAANRFRKLVNRGQLAVVEPSDKHYYQGGFTLVGGGLKSMSECVRPMKSVIHSDNVWLKNKVAEFNPRHNSITLDDGSEVKYDLLIVALGIRLRYDLIEGAEEALDLPGICSTYRPDLAEKTIRELSKFEKGEAIFTLPNAPIKCSGAAQKICYLADEIFKKRGVRNRIKLTYNTYLNDVFDVPKYAAALNEVIKEKSIALKLRRNLKKVDMAKKEATFEILSTNAKPTGEIETQKFDLLHVAPPCSPVKAMMNCKELTNSAGFLDVNAETLQSKKFDNVFGIGDCLGTPNKKTAAAIYSQMRTLDQNVPAFLKGKKPDAHYNGYSSCPLIVSFNRAVLAEFTPEKPLETMPINQARPLYSSYIIKRYALPFIYWHFGITGRWLGPSTLRKILRFGFSE